MKFKLLTASLYASSYDNLQILGVITLGERIEYIIDEIKLRIYNHEKV